MSDGPHRSLPMRRPWKLLAERAGTPAYAPQEVSEAFPVALKSDFREAPLAQVRDILGGTGQSSLFSEDRAARLEETRRMCRGSAAGNGLIDCAIEANANGLTGDNAYKTALENALEAHARAGCHQIEEHWRREEPRSTGHLRERLRAARDACSFNDLASELTAPDGGSRETRLQKHTGIDDGPPL